MYFELLARCAPLLLKGMMMTVQLFFAAACISFTVGSFFGIVLCRRLWQPLLSPFVEALCFVYRAIPFYVQLLIVYFVLPDLCGWSLTPFSASVFALGMCSSGYVAQSVRAGINSIPSVQWEASFNLGYTSWQALQCIILPQMVRNVLPTLVNELDALLKSTAIASSIGMVELTRAGMNSVSREMEPVSIYLTIAFLYLLLSSCINLAAKILEKRVIYAKN